MPWLSGICFLSTRHIHCRGMKSPLPRAARGHNRCADRKRPKHRNAFIRKVRIFKEFKAEGPSPVSLLPLFGSLAQSVFRYAISLNSGGIAISLGLEGADPGGSAGRFHREGPMCLVFFFFIYFFLLVCNLKRQLFGSFQMSSP